MSHQDKHLRDLRGLLLLLLVSFIPLWLATCFFQYLHTTGRLDLMLQRTQSAESAVSALRSLCGAFFIIASSSLGIVGYALFVVHQLRRDLRSSSTTPELTKTSATEP